MPSSLCNISAKQIVTSLSITILSIISIVDSLEEMSRDGRKHNWWQIVAMKLLRLRQAKQVNWVNDSIERHWCYEIWCDKSGWREIDTTIDDEDTKNSIIIIQDIEKRTSHRIYFYFLCIHSHLNKTIFKTCLESRWQ